MSYVFDTNAFSQLFHSYYRNRFPTLWAEAGFVGQIFAVPHFLQIIERKKLLKGGLNADPFIIARAHVIGAAVVTLEGEPPNGAKIPNICRHFGIPCMSLEGFMEAEDWTF